MFINDNTGPNFFFLYYFFFQIKSRIHDKKGGSANRHVETSTPRTISRVSIPDSRSSSLPFSKSRRIGKMFPRVENGNKRRNDLYFVWHLPTKLSFLSSLWILKILPWWIDAEKGMRKLVKIGFWFIFEWESVFRFDGDENLNFQIKLKSYCNSILNII